jgi:Holliday junction DNA helicase RuvA
MIGLLRGIVAGVGETSALIDVSGVGYLVEAGGRTLSRLQPEDAVTIWVETHVREDAIRLFGFLTDDERAWFASLQSVPGVGAKVALAVLDVLPPGALMDAIALQDHVSVARANGVGPKLATRIVQELKGKPPPRGLLSGGPGAFTAPVWGGDTTDRARQEGLGDMGRRNEAISALVNLGYPQAEALRAVSAAYRTFPTDPAVAELVRAALKELGR